MRTCIVTAVLASMLVVVVSPGAASGGTTEEGDERAVRIVDLNLLHGVFCPRETDSCQAPDRVALLMSQLETAQCPEVVGLQEINANLASLINQALPETCDGAYEVAFNKKPGTVDTERVLTTLPIRSTKVLKLPGGFRTASRAVLTSPLGPLVLVVTHQDGDPESGNLGPPCRRCPPVCRTKQTNVFACQTVASADLADRAGGRRALRVLMGDFNVDPTNARYQGLLADGWIDTFVLAENAECVPATGDGCSSGRDDMSIESIKDPTKRQVERIDFIFVKEPQGCAVQVDPKSDTNDNGVGTGLWNDEPTSDGPGGIAWTSDHTGVSADVSCGV
jgi:endonuclease/exonuclease/phosphatase family metal-dependent hydrolase